ncbi:MAG: hypothetical protein KJI69_06255 [Patescibacteria group bacterium]|nr:hypothetical protein [Patescibacteria group bacterium]
MAKGNFKDYGECISCSIENLVVLQELINDQGALVIEEDKATVLSDNLKGYQNKSQDDAKTEKKQDEKKKYDIPDLFKLEGINKHPSSIAPMPSGILNSGKKIPLERWIFGQYNKLLPVKANLRLMAHLLDQYREGIPLNELASVVFEIGPILGNYLWQVDLKNKHHRDSKLSIAFPIPGKKSEKSCARYINHFLARIDTKGQLSGLLVDLKLIDKTGKDKALLTLTDVGWEFMMLSNPILDYYEENSKKKFSDEEKRLVLDHIVKFVPVENFAFQSILLAIKDKANTPDKMDSFLQKDLSLIQDGNVTKSFLASQRSGAISRMADLDLVIRKRDGVKVSYSITDSGREYMSNVNLE